jgi:hypothetical protein
MRKKFLIGSVIAVVILILVSFTSVVGFQSFNNNPTVNSPLFGLRINRAIGEESKELNCKYAENDNKLPFPRNDKRTLFNKIINNLKTEEWKLEIQVSGGLLGYNVAVKNLLNETFNGRLIMNITIKSLWMLAGRILRLDEEINTPATIGPSCVENFKMRPVIGFGPAVINIEGEVGPAEYTYIQRCLEFDIEDRGFILLFFIGYDGKPIIVQGHDF